MARAKRAKRAKRVKAGPKQAKRATTKANTQNLTACGRYEIVQRPDGSHFQRLRDHI